MTNSFRMTKTSIELFLPLCHLQDPYPTYIHLLQHRSLRVLQDLPLRDSIHMVLVGFLRAEDFYFGFDQSMSCVKSVK